MEKTIESSFGNDSTSSHRNNLTYSKLVVQYCICSNKVPLHKENCFGVYDQDLWDKILQRTFSFVVVWWSSKILKFFSSFCHFHLQWILSFVSCHFYPFYLFYLFYPFYPFYLSSSCLSLQEIQFQLPFLLLQI